MRWSRLREAATAATELARTYGARGLVRRAAHEVRLRSGAYARLEPGAVEHATRPRLLAVDLPAARAVLDADEAAGRRLIDRALAMLDGRYPFFGDLVVETGWPPRWHHHARAGVDWPADAHWTASAHPPPGGGDIKWIWEPSRFHFAWLLPRAWALSGDRRFADETWRAFRDWLEHNPVGRGPNWYCAQELSLRCFAILFAASVFAPAGLASDEDLDRLARFLHAAAARIDRTLGHALSQRNNHALSEAVGLWTLARVLPDAPRAAAWQRRAERALRECVRDQFADDGAYIQESFNYHRLAVHVLLWARFVARSTDATLPDGVARALRDSSFFLHVRALPVGATELPNYGHNDGALLLALADGTHRDIRPTLQHLARELDETPPFDRGPWDEPAAWFGLDARRTRGHAFDRGLGVSSSGYVISRQRPTTILSRRPGASTVFSRIPAHTDHRPGQADALHVDVWRDGKNVALDPGTYAYSEPPPWDNALGETRVHNTCSVGDRSQMRRRGRFLWTNWTAATLVARHHDDDVSAWLARVPAAWGRDVVHTRLVVHGRERIDVLDLLDGGDAGDVMRLHWNLAGSAWTRAGDVWTDGSEHVLAVAAQPAAARAIVAEPAGVLGWWSPTYGVKEPCTALELEVRGARAMFHTCFAPGAPPPLPEDVRAAWLAGDLSAAFDAWTR